MWIAGTEARMTTLRRISEYPKKKEEKNNDNTNMVIKDVQDALKFSVDSPIDF